LGYLCNFDFDEHEKILDSLFFKEGSCDEKNEISLDIRSRLKINVENGNPVRKVYKGG